MISTIDNFFSTSKTWQNEMNYLRKIALDCMLTEEIKWKHPCYTFQHKNIIILHGFKEYCAILFFKGSLLQDAEKLITQQTENVQAARQLRFTSLPEIIEKEQLIKEYIFEAIEIEKLGLKVPMQPISTMVLTTTLQEILNKNLPLKKAFEALTPGRQRGYNLFFAAAKQSKTQVSRIENCIPRIMLGKGLTDCICGRSKKMPNCDGSHKFIGK